MNQDISIPANPELVTEAWVTDALRLGGILNHSRVISLRKELVGSQGIIGQVARLHLGYDTTEPNQKPSIIAKFPAPDPELRKNLQFMYQREICFYRTLDASSGISVPEYYFSATDESNAANILLLEDVSAHSQPGCLVCGCRLEEAEAALVRLAKFHATWWENPKLEQYPWLMHKREYINSYSGEQFIQDFEELLQRFRDEMPGFEISEVFIQSASLLARNYTKIKKLLYGAPTTLIHDDYHLDNMLFGGSETDPEPVIIDWQCVSKGPGVCDLAYFIGFCLSPEQRQQAEQDLLKAYYDTLYEHGVRGYDFNRFLFDYRLAALEPLERLVQVRHWVNHTDHRALELFESVLYRLDSFLEDSRIL